jgi:hypothetical protein
MDLGYCQLTEIFTAGSWSTILFDGSERTKVAARCTDNTYILLACLRFSVATIWATFSALTNDCREKQNPKVLEVRKDKTRQDHES